MTRTKVTRRKARAWLQPMRDCFEAMRRTGDAPAVRGYAVTRLHDKDDWVRIDECIAGFRSLIERLFPKLETRAMQRLQIHLANGIPVAPADLEACMRELRATEDLLITVTVEEIKRARVTEEIQIELDALSDRKAA